jgi:hypothetical protein
MTPQRGFNRRPLDLVLVVFFVLSILYGLLYSLPEGLGIPVSPDSPWPPLRSLYDWAVAQEPAHLDPPTSLLANGVYDGFIQSPMLLFVIWGLLHQRDWVRPLALVYGGAAIANMLIYFFVTFMGPTPPPHPAVYLPFNLPWLVAPAVLVLRMLRPEPFGAPGQGRASASAMAPG